MISDDDYKGFVVAYVVVESSFTPDIHLGWGEFELSDEHYVLDIQVSSFRSGHALLITLGKVFVGPWRMLSAAEDLHNCVGYPSTILMVSPIVTEHPSMY